MGSGSRLGDVRLFGDRPGYGELAAAIVLCSIVACSAGKGNDREAAPAAGSLEAAVAAVERGLEVYEGTIPGVLVLVRVDDGTDVVTMGEADVAEHVAIDEKQTFAIASLTKPMVAALVLQLVGEHRLKLDDDVHQWLPELRKVRSPITVEQLLSHRSGLQEVTAVDIQEVGSDHSDLLKRAASHRLLFEPGTGGSYGNINYAALGLIAERILDQPLAEALQERIFEALGMGSTSLAGSPDVHNYEAGEDVTADNDLELFGPAGGVVSTVGDLDRFFGALWAGDLLEAGLVDQMREARGTLSQSGHEYGLGLDHASVECGAVVGHDGELGGIITGAWTLEDDDQRFVAVMMNDNSIPAARYDVVEDALCS